MSQEQPSGSTPIEPAETGSSVSSPDDARRTVDELEEELVDEPSERDREAEPAATEDDESDLATPAAGEPEPPD
ncbi:hypothetical protein [Gordonia paraffinivorans]|uniref:hypothetical protein n=1 Tax=Gordonia paraffinivorans TaxID=175628 RepID=UPI000D61FB99|nr:hypothetical protein [Gordonia paraffinivorans]MBY4572669.1 hypothetical protein [Gordonia paraffinivorans]PWD43785.1 hypothetical protein ACN93_08170 [Gordonia paraffinivorans]